MIVSLVEITGTFPLLNPYLLLHVAFFLLGAQGVQKMALCIRKLVRKPILIFSLALQVEKVFRLIILSLF